MTIEQDIPTNPAAWLYPGREVKIRLRNAKYEAADYQKEHEGIIGQLNLREFTD